MSERLKAMATSLKLCILAVLGVTAGMAAPMCTAETYNNYAASGFSCSLGAETFSNFSALSFENSIGVPVLSSTQVLVTPTTVGNSDSLAFSYETTTGAPLTISLTDGDQVFGMVLSYQTIASTSLLSIQMASSFGNTTPGSVSALKQAANVTSIFASGVTDNGVSNVSATYLGPVTPVTGGTGLFNVQDTISLQAQSGSVTDSGFANTFVTMSRVPEPPANILIGGGLLLISSLVRRVSRNKSLKV
jgi:hypothetical protein